MDEISNRLGQHPAVQFAIVTANGSEGEAVQLNGYVLFKQELPPANASDLQEYLLKHLPSYMIPGAFFRLKELPISSNGKIDLALLPKVTAEILAGRKPVQDSGNEIQTTLLTAVRELLKNPAIGPKDNFFLAGGHSLLGMQLIMRLRDAFKVDMTARELFAGPTVEQLAVVVERKRVQSQLAKIWKELLDAKQCGPDANFTSLGGNEHLINELQMRIASEFGRYLTHAELAECQTLSGQTELVYGAMKSEALLPPGAFMVHSERQSNNIFWLHYANPMLAEAIGAERPFLCLTLTEQDFKNLGEAPSLPEIARHFLPRIIASQPHGPYVVGGFCLGGILSYEVACQLQAAGHEVALLVLLDVPSPEYYRPAELKQLMKKPLYVSKRLKQLGFRKALARVLERASEKVQGAEKLQVNAERALVPSQSLPTQVIMENAAYRYKPARYEGKVALIMASERLPNSPPHDDFLPWWRSLIHKDLHEHAVNAFHLDLVEGGAVNKVAEAISSHLKPSDQVSAHN